MHARIRIATAGCLLAAVVSGCSLTGATTEVHEELGNGMVAVNGITNEPIGEVAVAATIDTPIGEMTLETYDSALGPCVTVTYPDGRQEASCHRGSGIDPRQPVTGNPEQSIEGMNLGGWNAGLTHGGIGMVHTGLVHPSVHEVVIEPADGSAPSTFRVVRAPNVDGLAVVIAWSAPGVDTYRLVARDADGCVVDSESVRLVVPAGPEGGPAVPPDGNAPGPGPDAGVC